MPEHPGQIGAAGTLRRLVTAAASALFLVLPAVAQTAALTAEQALPGTPKNQMVTERLKALQASLIDGPDAIAIDMLSAGGLGDVVHLATYAATTEPDWAPRPASVLDAQAMNLRLALTMLTQAYGADDVNDVLAAQSGGERRALVLRSGTASLADVRQLLRGLRLQPVTDSGPLTLTVPLVLWSGASLQLREGEVLHLSRTDGAFLMNFGLLQMQGATIASVGGTNVTSPVFASFVTTADGGVIQAQRAAFRDLGFGRTAKFSGVAIMQGTIRTSAHKSWLEDSTFSGVTTVSVSMARDVLLRGNHFSNMRARALHISRSIGAQVLLNVFSGKMRTNAILLEDGSTGSRVAGNVVLQGKRAGIVVRNESKDVLIAHNIVWRRDGAGLALVRSDCGLIVENLVLDNDQKGVEVRTSLNAEVTRNIILSNHSAGLWVSAQPEGAVTFLRDNDLAENGSGISAADGAALYMTGNDFSHQFPKFLDGDLAHQASHVARNLNGRSSMILTAGGAVPSDDMTPDCSH